MVALLRAKNAVVFANLDKPTESDFLQFSQNSKKRLIVAAILFFIFWEQQGAKPQSAGVFAFFKPEEKCGQYSTVAPQCAKVW